jgi:hypothetical protein
MLERLSDFAFDKAGDDKVAYADVGVSKVGTLRRGNIKCYRDTFAGGNYVLLGFKGPTPYDSGIIFCPYIPLQLNRATGTDDFSPRVGIRTRYGVLDHLFGAGKYYQMIAINDTTGSTLAADGGRVFLY